MRVPQVSERIKEAPAQALRGVFAGIGQLLLITDKLRNKTPVDVPQARTPEPTETAADVTVSEPAGQREQAAEPARATPSPAGSTPAESTPAESTPAESTPAESTPAESAPAGPSATVPTAAASAPARPSRKKAAPATPAPASPASAKPARAKPTRAQAPKAAPSRDFDKTGNVRLISDDEGTAAAAASTPTASTPTAGTAPAGTASAAAAAESAQEVPAPPLPNYDQLSIASLRARLRSLDVTQVRQLTVYERAHAGRADVIAMFERRIVKLEAEA